MAANFWTSTHYLNWLRNAGTILEEAGNLRTRDSSLFTEEELVRLQVLFVQLISTLARKTSLRQRVAATAIVYFKRFYLRCGFIDHDPRLIAPVSLYLAAKVEEHTISAKAIVIPLNSLYKADHPYPYTVADLYDYEFRLIAELDFDLIIFHPYRPLMQYCAVKQLSSCMQVAWAIVNDSYRTDVCLQYPPYLVAMACLYMAATLENKNVDSWIESMNVDVAELSNVVKTISMVYLPSKTIKSMGRDNSTEVLNAKLQSYYAPRIKQQQHQEHQDRSHSQRRHLQGTSNMGKASLSDMGRKPLR